MQRTPRARIKNTTEKHIRFPFGKIRICFFSTKDTKITKGTKKKYIFLIILLYKYTGHKSSIKTNAAENTE